MKSSACEMPTDPVRNDSRLQVIRIQERMQIMFWTHPEYKQFVSHARAYVHQPSVWGGPRSKNQLSAWLPKAWEEWPAQQVSVGESNIVCLLRSTKRLVNTWMEAVYKKQPSTRSELRMHTTSELYSKFIRLHAGSTLHRTKPNPFVRATQKISNSYLNGRRSSTRFYPS